MASNPKYPVLTAKRKHEIELLIEAFDLVPAWMYPLSDTIIKQFSNEWPREFDVIVEEITPAGIIRVTDRVTSVVFAERKRVSKLRKDHFQLDLF